MTSCTGSKILSLEQYSSDRILLVMPNSFREGGRLSLEACTSTAILSALTNSL
jgi:hypothetical protein